MIKNDDLTSSKTEELMPSGLFHRLFYLYELKILLQKTSPKSGFPHLFRLPEEFQFERQFESFHDYYLSHKTRRSFVKCFVFWLLPQWSLQALGFCISNLLKLYQILIVSKLMGSLSGGKEESLLLICITSFVVSVLRAFINLRANTPIILASSKVEAIFHGEYFRKLSTVKLTQAGRVDVGAIENGLTVDLMRVTAAVINSHQAISSSIPTAVALKLIAQRLGWSSIIGLVVFFLTVAVQLLISRHLVRSVREKLTVADKRNRAIAAILAGMKAIKLSAWEGVVGQRVDLLRRQETRLTQKILFLRCALYDIFSLAPFVAVLLCFIVMKGGLRDVNLEAMFVSVGMLNYLGKPLQEMVAAVSNCWQALPGLQRLAAFVELPDETPSNESGTVRGELLMNDVCASLDDGKKRSGSTCFKLKSISLHVQPGTLLCITGSTGSGKSSLLKAAAGLLPTLRGEVQKSGSIAYVPQEGFLFNGSLKENILFGHAEDATFYNEVLEMCALKPDLRALPWGDQTRLGEGGASLSGGQRQRVGLARALYARADIYLVDDCLSALDGGVLATVSQRVFRQHLRTKTVVLVSNDWQQVSGADWVLLLEKGRVSRAGKPESLRKLPFFRQAISDRRQVVEENETPPLFKNSIGPCLENSPASEDRFRGLVGLGIYGRFVYVGGLGFFALTVLLLGVSVILPKYVLKLLFSFDYSGNPSLQNFISSYSWMLALLMAAMLLKSIFFSLFGSRTTYRLFRGFFDQLLAKRVSFFLSTPGGRLLNLTTRDTELVEAYLLRNMFAGLSHGIQLCISIYIAFNVSPLSLPVIALCLGCFALLSRGYLSTAIELKRQQQSATAPLLSRVREFGVGLPLFRLFGQEQLLREDFSRAVNLQLSVGIHDKLLTVFIVFLLELGTAFVATFLRVLVALPGQRGSSKGKTPLALSETLVIAGLLPAFFYSVIDGSTRNISSAQRLLDGLDEQETEKRGVPPPSGWPRGGRIEVKRLSANYGPGLPPVLRDVSFRLDTAEKTAVLGRTGSGKTSLLLALAAVIEPHPGGQILIDEESLESISPQLLREKIVTISQEPFFFAGSVRENVDPRCEFSDADIIAALKAAQVWDSSFFTRLDENKRLSCPIEEGGANLSQGERQLLCIAQAILLKPKVLLMDEATASLDKKVAAKVHELFFNEFKESTIVSVTHQLESIHLFDKIIVMDQGALVAIGKPAEVLKDTSIFSTPELSFSPAKTNSDF